MVVLCIILPDRPSVMQASVRQLNVSSISELTVLAGDSKEGDDNDKDKSIILSSLTMQFILVVVNS